MNSSKQIDNKISELKDWRGKTMEHLRTLILSVDDSLKEEFKWDTPVFTCKGNVCALGVFKDHIKVNFFKGAKIEDSHHLFNAGLDAKNSRAIDLTEDSLIPDKDLKDLVKKAIKLNS